MRDFTILIFNSIVATAVLHASESLSSESFCDIQYDINIRKLNQTCFHPENLDDLWFVVVLGIKMSFNAQATTGC